MKKKLFKWAQNLTHTKYRAASQKFFFYWNSSLKIIFLLNTFFGNQIRLCNTQCTSSETTIHPGYIWKWLNGVRKKNINTKGWGIRQKWANYSSMCLKFEHWGCNLLAFDREINVLYCWAKMTPSENWERDNYVSGHSGCHLGNINDQEVPMSVIRCRFPTVSGRCRGCCDLTLCRGQFCINHWVPWYLPSKTGL